MEVVNDSDALVCHVLKARYFLRACFLPFELGRNPSFTWCIIWAAQDLVRKGIRWKIGDGQSVSVWRQPWVGDDSSFWINTPVVDGFENLQVANLFVPGNH
ncbi:hypothetical protein ACS0TY_018037 [Phlomoides rotata]